MMVGYVIITLSLTHYLRPAIDKVSSMAYCRVESIDPDTKEIVYLKKRKSDRASQNNHRGLMEALERASNIHQKTFSSNKPSETSSDAEKDIEQK